MAALSALMAGAAVVGVGSSLAGGYANQQAALAKASADSAAADSNARLANVAAEDAIARGEKDAARIKTSARRITGAQRAAMAAQGLDPDQGTGADLQVDTAVQSAADATTVKNNAWREAWGYRVQAVNATTQGRFAQIEGSARARSSILTGGLEAGRYGLQAGYYGLGGR